MRRARVEIIRRTRTQLTPTLTHQFPINNANDVTAIILIDSGQWLLTASGTRSVLYYDLDNRQPVKMLLIHDQIEYFPDL